MDVQEHATVDEHKTTETKEPVKNSLYNGNAMPQTNGRINWRRPSYACKGRGRRGLWE